ncbi:uncharacterized protein CC84DRAFT_190634 [Paraphaeosphaeria sporulosa]|uniref:Uncharacterized protein n=1 Tax=Paraphaeosphaeria sporulosa TaxID=1460663 RepID=A0A177C0R2_9PLEO|nr:uncharacterized protein CC84DRAFT_190634 [Paraphaeosphaeria sporulosa]OAG01384.1 hypothetical protein CC84DRAFT_190634 [Paraphaeosphaeria sporulosa]
MKSHQFYYLHIGLYALHYACPGSWLVNTSTKVADGAIQLCHLNYHYGFLASALAFIALYWAFPSAKVDEFVTQE